VGRGTSAWLWVTAGITTQVIGMMVIAVTGTGRAGQQRVDGGVALRAAAKIALTCSAVQPTRRASTR
jgi:hypothetical protein